MIEKKEKKRGLEGKDHCVSNMMNVQTWEAVRYSVCVGVTVALDKETGKRKEVQRKRERRLDH
jgi:hypothetical protein